MIALFFEVLPYADKVQKYLDLAAMLRPKLDASGGCLFIDRFRSRQREGWILSFQIWQDEASLTRWRTNGDHHGVQTAGRGGIFADYRLRVAQVVRQEEPGKPAWQPQRLNVYNDPARRPPRYLTLIEADTNQFAGRELEFESIYRRARYVQLSDVASYAEALDVSEQCQVVGGVQFRICEVERDYGMFERNEAPTYYPPISAAPHQ